MKAFLLVLLLPLSALAQTFSPPPQGYSPTAPCLSNPCQSPDWIYYYPNPNGVASSTPQVWFRVADPPADPPAVLDAPGTGNHPGVGAPEINSGGATAAITLLLGMLAVLRGKPQRS